MEEDLLTDLYVHLKALDLLIDTLDYKMNEEWDFSLDNNTRSICENTHAMIFSIKLVVKQLWKIRKIYYWRMCKEKYGQ